VLAWTNQTNDEIEYAVVDGSGLTFISGPVALSSPYSRWSDYVSVTADREGHAILTWMDVEQKDYLYYAVVDGSGAVITPPMIYRTGMAADPDIKTNSEGEGNAPYFPGLYFVPLTQKEM